MNPFETPWLSPAQIVGWLRTASPDLVRSLGAAPENRNRFAGMELEANFAKSTGIRVHHHAKEAAIEDLRSMAADAELELYYDDPRTGVLEKISPRDAAAFEIDKDTLKARVPGRPWSDRFRLRADEIWRLRPELTAAEEVATNPDCITVPSSEAAPTIPADPAELAEVAHDPGSINVVSTEAAKNQADLSSSKAPAADPSAIVDPYKTGLPGRRTIAHLIKNEFDRRRKEGETEVKLKDEAAALHHWAATTHPTAPTPTVTTIENQIRQLHRAYRESLA